MLDKLERKFGKYAVHNLMMYLVLGYVIGYVFNLLTLATAGRTGSTNVVSMLMFEPYYIMHGQVWRLITWVLIPPRENVLFLVIMLFMYYQLGTALENTWGAFKFNVYIFGGMLLTMLAGFADYFIMVYLLNWKPEATIGIGYFVTTYYILMSIFLAFSVYFPNMEVRLYFIIPIKMKWMSIFYGILILTSIVTNPWYLSIIIVASMLNFLFFFLSTRNMRRISPKEIKRKRNFVKSYNQGVESAKKNVMYDRNGVPITRHRCAICGRTEADDDKLEFRYCSKCVGNFEYCSDHLFTHVHKM